MIELVFVACLAGATEQCREHSLVYVDITPMTCLMGAQPQLAQWAEGHPAFRIESWKCRRVQFAEQDA